jgi:hypothetical protein
MRIKNIEIEFDFLDADNVELFEKEAQKVVEKTQTERKEMTYSQALRMECDIVEDFLDSVFGKGLSKDLFGGKKNLKEHIEIFQYVVDEKNKAQADMQKLYDKYAPKQKKESKK